MCRDESLWPSSGVLVIFGCGIEMWGSSSLLLVSGDAGYGSVSCLGWSVDVFGTDP